MERVERTLAWIGLGLLNGVAVGTIAAILFGWTTVGCSADGAEAVNDALPFGAILGGMIGVIGGAVCEARSLRMRPFVLTAATALILGCCLLSAHGMSGALRQPH